MGWLPIGVFPKEICCGGDRQSTLSVKDCLWRSALWDERGYWKAVRGIAKKVFLTLKAFEDILQVKDSKFKREAGILRFLKSLVGLL